MPKYLVKIILIVNAKGSEEAKRVVDYVITIPIPDSKIENPIESMSYEEIVPITDRKPR